MTIPENTAAMPCTGRRPGRMSDEELSAELIRIAEASFPWASNGRFAQADAVRCLIDVIEAIGDTPTFSRLLNGLRHPSEREIEHGDGQPDEAQEWRDYDPDC